MIFTNDKLSNNFYFYFLIIVIFMVVKSIVIMNQKKIPYMTLSIDMQRLSEEA